MTKKTRAQVADERIVDELIEAARNSGWQDDQGTGRAVDSAAEQQRDERTRILRHLTRLRRAAAKGGAR